MQFKLCLRGMTKTVTDKTVAKIFNRNTVIQSRVKALRASSILGLDVGHGKLKAPLGNRLFTIEW
jgi:hypothetical protein